MQKKQPWSVSLIFLLIIVILTGIGFAERPTLVVAAQSTGDTLPTRTPTPGPAATATASSTRTPTSVPKVWVGRLVSNTLAVTEGQGSIIRVSVQGIMDTPIELHSGNQLIVAKSGSKPEYGPYAAEFAPVTKGTWTASVPALGVSLDVVADNYNLAVIEFVQIPEPESTQVIRPTPSPTPLGGINWEGRLVSETTGAGVPFSRLLIRVVGRDNHPVRLSTLAQVVNTANTGQKPDELGPNTVEFTGLTPGKYIVEPVGLGAFFQVELKPNVETRLEFRPQPAPPTATASPTSPPLPSPTATPAPSTYTPTPSITPTPTSTDTATPTVTPSPTLTATPLPSPTPVTRWLGIVESRTDTGSEPSAIVVRVAGIEGLPIRLYATDGTTEIERRCITGQGGVGQDGCIFRELMAGQYLIAPEGLGLSLPVRLFKSETVRVSFDIEVFPPGITGWQARLRQNSNGYYAVPKTEAIIRVWVVGQAGQVVALHSVRGTERFCEVRPNPVLGGLICEFGQLGPGVYEVEALNTGVSLRVFTDGMGLAEVEFSPSATYATLALAQSSPLVGHGAQPDLPTPLATATLVPRIVVQPTPTPTVTLVPTPTPVFAWQGRIVESTIMGVGAIGVRAAGLKDHPVVLHSGGWQSQPQLTGTKVELGEYATEFSGLAQGEYIVELVNLTELKVKLAPGQFILVEFRYDFVNPP